jgi:uncharacterized protein
LSETQEPAATEDQPAKPPEHPQTYDLRSAFFGPEGLRAGWGLALFLLLRELLKSCIYPLIFRFFPLPSRQYGLFLPQNLLVSESAALLCVVIATVVMGRIENRPMADFGAGGPHRLRHLLAGLGWGFALLSVLILILYATGRLMFVGLQLHGTRALYYGAVWLAGFLLVGLFEEGLSRGYTQATLARGMGGLFRRLGSRRSDAAGFWTAALLTSFGFGFGHLDNTGESPVGLIAAGLIGLVFCLSLWRTGSLWWAIGFHASWDWAQSFLYGVADSGTMAQGHLVATHPVGRSILSGGATGPEGSLFVIPIAALSAVVILITLPSRRIQVARGEQ